MTRQLCLAATLSISLLPWSLLGEARLVAPNLKIGNHLETPVRITLGDGAPDDGLEITVKSADPRRLLISKGSDQPGAASVVIQTRQGYRESPEFWLQALDSSGSVEYTAEAAGFTKGTGTVSLFPSGVTIVGPLKYKTFETTTGGEPKRITLYTVRLDPDLKFTEEQAAAGSSPLSIDVVGSNDAIGHTVDPRVVIQPGKSFGVTQFKPAGEGQTTLSVKQPPGFSQSKDFSEVLAVVRKPGLAITDQQVIGQNLQVAGVLSLGEYPSEKGVNVTLTSDDPSQLLLSSTPTGAGSKSISIEMQMNKVSTRYYLQALGKSGTVTYSATAPGFRKRTAVVGLAPSGVIITPVWQGPPDEAQVLRADAPESKSKFSMPMTKRGTLQLIVWTAQLDPATHRSADITVQGLRGGLSLTIPLTNSNPSVGKVPLQVTIPGGSDHVIAQFTPKSVGSTEVTVTTPKDFTPSANSTAVVGFIRK